MLVIKCYTLMSMWVPVPSEAASFIYFGCIPRKRLLGYVILKHLISGDVYILFSTVAVLIHLSTNNTLHYSLSTFEMAILFDRCRCARNYFYLFSRTDQPSLPCPVSLAGHLPWQWQQKKKEWSHQSPSCGGNACCLGFKWYVFFCSLFTGVYLKSWSILNNENKVFTFASLIVCLCWVNFSNKSKPFFPLLF